MSGLRALCVGRLLHPVGCHGGGVCAKRPVGTRRQLRQWPGRQDLPCLSCPQAWPAGLRGDVSLRLAAASPVQHVGQAASALGVRCVSVAQIRQLKPPRPSHETCILGRPN